jgi:hypothetical protein
MQECRGRDSGRTGVTQFDPWGAEGGFPVDQNFLRSKIVLIRRRWHAFLTGSPCPHPRSWHRLRRIRPLTIKSCAKSAVLSHPVAREPVSQWIPCWKPAVDSPAGIGAESGGNPGVAAVVRRWSLPTGETFPPLPPGPGYSLSETDLAGLLRGIIHGSLEGIDMPGVPRRV